MENVIHFKWNSTIFINSRIKLLSWICLKIYHCWAGRKLFEIALSTIYMPLLISQLLLWNKFYFCVINTSERRGGGYILISETAKWHFTENGIWMKANHSANILLLLLSFSLSLRKYPLRRFLESFYQAWDRILGVHLNFQPRCNLLYLKKDTFFTISFLILFTFSLFSVMIYRSRRKRLSKNLI